MIENVQKVSLYINSNTSNNNNQKRKKGTKEEVFEDVMEGENADKDLVSIGNNTSLIEHTTDDKKSIPSDPQNKLHRTIDIVI